jgi:hypothetical protein
VQTITVTELPPQGQPPRTKKKNKRWLIFLLAAALFVSCGITYAANVRINSGSAAEFGQGSTIATACDKYLSVALSSEVSGANNTFYVKNVTVSDISTKLHDKRVKLYLVDGTSSAILSTSNLYFDVDATGAAFTSPLTVTSTPDDTTVSTHGANEVGMSSLTFSNVVAQDGSKIPSTQVSKVLLETSKSGNCSVPIKSCAAGGACALGDIGPGGGPVIYVAQTPFTEPVSGNTFKYIEAAPANWVAGVIDPASYLCASSSSIPSQLSSAIGAAVQNTNAYLAVPDCTGQSSSSTPTGLSKVVTQIRQYGSGWNLPTTTEVQLMCKLARFGATVAPTKTNCTDSGGNLDTTKWVASSYLTSSKQSGAGWAAKVYFDSGVTNDTTTIQATRATFRPVRYFN